MVQTKSHWLYRFLDVKKTNCFQFSVPGFWGIHKNLKQEKKKFNSHEGFLRKFSNFLLGFKLSNVALLNLCMKFEFFFDQKHSFEAFWKLQQEKISITCTRVHQIQDLCSKKLDFLKKPSRELNFFLVLGSYESLEGLEL